MRLSQSALLSLFGASFIAGLLLAFFCDVFYMTRLWLMPSNVRYTVPAIQKALTKRGKKGSAKACKGFTIAVFLGDVLLCLVGAIMLILILYWLNNGSFRATAPLCMAAGFGLWHSSISKGVRIALQWFAFGIETMLYTILKPFKLLFAWIARTLKKNAQKRHISRLAKERQTYTKQQLQNIDRTAEMLLSTNSNSRTQKGDHHARKSKKAV